MILVLCWEWHNGFWCPTQSPGGGAIGSGPYPMIAEGGLYKAWLFWFWRTILAPELNVVQPGWHQACITVHLLPLPSPAFLPWVSIPRALLKNILCTKPHSRATSCVSCDKRKGRYSILCYLSPVDLKPKDPEHLGQVSGSVLERQEEHQKNCERKKKHIETWNLPVGRCLIISRT